MSHKIVKTLYLSLDLIHEIEHYAKLEKLSFNGACAKLIAKSLPTAPKETPPKEPDTPQTLVLKETGNKMLDATLAGFVDKHQRIPTDKEIKDLKKKLGIK